VGGKEGFRSEYGAPAKTKFLWGKKPMRVGWVGKEDETKRGVGGKKRQVFDIVAFNPYN